MPAGPSGITRINARKQHPNDRIAFIRPMEGPADRHISEDYLSRLAASVVPIMRKHFLSVTALCDYPANKEFLGRNFNGGERIDLVLKNNAGQWYPFKFVQGVLIHELAHNGQMNHSKAFWALRQIYHDELKGLWALNYTGEGLWGRGVDLESGEFLGGNVADGYDLPEHLCGGTYRSSRKRRKPTLGYKERKERRILKKFGANGQALGADEEIKVKLEKGKKPVGKPRVAGSARGRELRAAAALARFDIKREEAPMKAEEVDSETDSDDVGDSPADEAIDIDGRKLYDEKGQGMIKVCEDEDGDNADARNEMAELQDFRTIASGSKNSKPADPHRHGAPEITVNNSGSKTRQHKPLLPEMNMLDNTALSNLPRKGIKINGKALPLASKPEKAATLIVKVEDETVFASENESLPRFKNPIAVDSACSSTPQSYTANIKACPICSMDNDRSASICVACSHVLDLSRVSGTWTCGRKICHGSSYVNCVDVGICGVCGKMREGSS